MFRSKQKKDEIQGAETLTNLKLNALRTLSTKPTNFQQVYFLTPFKNDKILIVTSKHNEISSPIISLINLITSKMIQKTLIKSGFVTQQLFSAHLNLFFTCTSDRYIKLWTCPSFRSAGEIEHPKKVLDFVQIEGTDFLASCGFFSGIYLWNVRLGQQGEILRSKDDSCFDKLNYIAKYDWIIGVEHNVVHVFDWKGKQQKYVFAAHGALAVTLIEYYPKIDRFLLQYMNGETHNIKYHEDKGFESVWKIPDQYGFVKESFLLENRYLIMVMVNKPAQVFDCVNAKKLGTISIYHNERIAYLQKRQMLLVFNPHTRRMRFFLERKTPPKTGCFAAFSDIYICY